MSTKMKEMVFHLLGEKDTQIYRSLQESSIIGTQRKDFPTVRPGKEHQS